MLLALRVAVELFRYEIAYKIGGFRALHESVRKTSVSPRSPEHGVVPRVCEAVSFAACFYWKPVLCMQRAVVITRLLRRRGVKAEVVIGYRPAPFFSHAWVEVNGRVVNDSPAYRERLFVLERL
jgi:hypothetical protein